MSRLKVVLLFGGRSGEHEVSRNSANTVAKALSNNYDVFPIGIAKDGQWYGPVRFQDIKEFRPEQYADKKVTILPNPESGGTVYSLPDLEPVIKGDVFFPVLHGTFGEDGTLQGLLEMAQVPYVGAGVLASAAGMDKVLMKMVFSQVGLPQVKFLYCYRHQVETGLEAIAVEVEEKLGYPCFVKPANLGSSVGISKVKSRPELAAALLKAAHYDRKIIIEEGVNAREIEISILGNDEPMASLPGEIVPCNEFYDYDAKYIDDRSLLHIPAQLEEGEIKKIQDLARRAYQALDCTGLARIDFFITRQDNQILLNEINTLPGFTSISMYPKLWDHSGIPVAELTDRLIKLALERFRENSKNATSYDI